MPDTGLVLFYGGMFLVFIGVCLLFVPGKW